MRNYQAIQAIFFDMDGTLVNSESLWKIAERDWIRQKGGILEPELQEKFTGITAEAMVTLAKAHFGWQEDTKALTLELNDFVKGYLKQVKEQPGASELIDLVVKHNIPRALVSNSALDIIEATLANQPWRHLLEQQFSINHVTRGKPEPDIYLLAANTLGVEAKHCLVIEDSIAGVTAAVAAKMRCIAVCHEHQYRQNLEALTPEVVSSLYEVINVLQRVKS
jgi:HAD superfamily hydrolase (TIGR01509 family)